MITTRTKIKISKSEIKSFYLLPVMLSTIPCYHHQHYYYDDLLLPPPPPPPPPPPLLPLDQRLPRLSPSPQTHITKITALLILLPLLLPLLLVVSQPANTPLDGACGARAEEEALQPTAHVPRIVAALTQASLGCHWVAHGKGVAWWVEQ